VWTRGGQRAPHKPLLLIWALGRVQRGEERTAPFTRVADEVGRLLDEFGPPRKTQAAYPFWHAQADGVWEVITHGGVHPKKGGSSPTATALLDADAEGGFPSDIDALLRLQPQLLLQARMSHRLWNFGGGPGVTVRRGRA